MPAIAPSLRALLSHLIDYAGLYPPAALSLSDVAGKYERYQASEYGWMLNRVVLPLVKLAEAPVHDGWRIALLVDSEPGPLPPQVETLETKLPHRLSLPTYCEAPPDAIGGAFAKMRTGGLTPDTIPSTGAIADFLCYVSQHRVPFKATAGLHHPMRSMRALTYAADSPRSIMHGFLNVFIAAASAWYGEDELLEDILQEEDPRAFTFVGDVLHWRDYGLSTEQIETSRRDFAHSFGSCSFEEPVADLRELGLLP
ncbi:MAG TPA: hypothetical protein VHW09_25270 [Bryobacteraceae bacterium]|jgi:hypothetical protein|nr:hypothetical protein [Bryobacteraceae bacterium]